MKMNKKERTINLKMISMLIYFISIVIVIFSTIYLSNMAINKTNLKQIDEMGGVIVNNFISDIKIGEKYYNESEGIKDRDERYSVQKVLENFYNNNSNKIFAMCITRSNDNVVIANTNPNRVGEQSSKKELIDQVTQTKQKVTGVYNLETKEGKVTIYDISTPFYFENKNEVRAVVSIAIRLDELISTTKALQRKMFLINFIIIIIYMIIAYFLFNKLSNRIINIMNISNNIANKNLLSNNYKKSSVKEIYELNNSFKKMTTNLKNIILKFKNNSNNILKKNQKIIEDMDNISNRTKETHEESQNILTEMENSSATIEEILASVEEISSISENLLLKTESTNENAEQIQQKTQINKQTSLKSLEETNKLYEEKKIKIIEAVNKSKVIKEIKEITNIIQNVANQTNLLSLNASIESARAGEAGRGFAVVAEEIRKLSKQTKEALTEIDPMISKIENSVGELSSVSYDTLDFIKNKIEINNEMLQKTNKEYIDDTDIIKTDMDEITCISKEVTQSIEQIAKAIDDLSKSIENTAANSEHISEKLKDVNEISNKTKEDMNSQIKSTEKLSKEINEFKTN